MNATQGHQADIREVTDAVERCKIIQRGMNGDPALTKTLLDGVDRADWPEGEEL